MAQQSQRCKVTFESSAAVPTRHYLLVGPETSRYDEVWHKVLGEYRKTEFHEGRDLASLYWIDSETDEVLVDSQEAYDSALSYVVPDQTGISYLKLFARSKSKFGDETAGKPFGFKAQSQAKAKGADSLSGRPSRGLNRPYYGGLPANVTDALRTSSEIDGAYTGRSRKMNNIVKFENGMTNGHNSRKPLRFTCKQCSEVFATRRLLKAHVAAHSNEIRRMRRQQRKNAESVMNGSEELNEEQPEDNHADSIASGEDEFPRTKNEETGQNGQESTPRRADAVTAGKFPCQKCDRVFNEVRQLRGHQSIHSSRQTFMGTKRRKLSKTQKNSTENKSDPDACLVKEEGSNRSASLGVDGEGMRVQAERSRGTRSVLCSASKAAEMNGDFRTDGNETTFRSLLQANASATNGTTEEEGYPCAKCDRVFKHIQQLRGHQAAHVSSTRKRRNRQMGDLAGLTYDGEDLDETLETPAQKRKRSFPSKHNSGPPTQARDAFAELLVSEDVTDETSMKEELQCQKCDRSFATRRQLQGHQAFHSAKGKFACDRCHHGFRTREVLTEHQAECTGSNTDPEKRLFSCVPACGRLFDGKKTLNHHRQNCGFVTEGGDDGEDKQPEDDEESEVELDDSNNGKQQDLPAAEDGRSKRYLTLAILAKPKGSVILPYDGALIATAAEEETALGLAPVAHPPHPQSPLRHAGQREKSTQSSNATVIVKRKPEEIVVSGTAGTMPKFYLSSEIVGAQKV